MPDQSISSSSPNGPANDDETINSTKLKHDSMDEIDIDAEIDK